MKKATLKMRVLAPVVAVAMMLTATAFAAAPGITGGTGNVTFNLVASPAFITQPDGQMVYSWGYGCAGGAQPGFAPSTISAGSVGCPTMQTTNSEGASR